ncbi:MAG: YkgJ family cysteine cluster protein [Treponema sp.]|jgi:Fe-S-cluster containining protein|nr:YkgJ family cysteine cluster protein [Treponema sp.]
MTEIPFYSGGLCFSCTRCSACCRHESGFVFLSQNDLSRLVKMCQMDYTAFVKTYCRWVSFDRNREQLSLREKSNYDCVFWNNGCTVYQARPLQCRTFPFWDSTLASSAAWKAAGEHCPGIGAGAPHSRDAIEACLRAAEDEPVMERGM